VAPSSFQIIGSDSRLLRCCFLGLLQSHQLLPQSAALGVGDRQFLLQGGSSFVFPLKLRLQRCQLVLDIIDCLIRRVCHRVLQLLSFIKLRLGFIQVLLNSFPLTGSCSCSLLQCQIARFLHGFKLLAQGAALSVRCRQLLLLLPKLRLQRCQLAVEILGCLISRLCGCGVQLPCLFQLSLGFIQVLLQTGSLALGSFQIAGNSSCGLLCRRFLDLLCLPELLLLPKLRLQRCQLALEILGCLIGRLCGCAVQLASIFKLCLGFFKVLLQP